MGIYNEDTKELITRDVKAFQARQKEIRKRLAEALEGFDDGLVHSALTSTLFYGWRTPDGRWRSAPVAHRREITYNDGGTNE